jgi:protein-L-isoaspartate(D-aspartate) O-methyltransferase
MQGAGAHPPRELRLGGPEARLRIDDDALAVDAEALTEAFQGPRWDVRTGVALRSGEAVPIQLDLWLACTLDTYGRLNAPPPALRYGSSASWNTDSLVYLTARPAHGSRSFELGVGCHGPHAEGPATAFVEQVLRWDREHRHGPAPVIRAFPASTPDSALPAGRVLDRPHTRLVISWP